MRKYEEMVRTSNTSPRFRISMGKFVLRGCSTIHNKIKYFKTPPLTCFRFLTFGFRAVYCCLEQQRALVKCNELLTPPTYQKRRIPSRARPEIYTSRRRTLSRQF